MKPAAAEIWLRLAPLAGAAAWCAAAALWLESTPLCGFRGLTGLPCPLCGLTHALPALACGRWREALEANALSPLAAGLLVTAPLLALAPSVERKAWLGAAAAFCVYGVLRWF